MKSTNVGIVDVIGILALGAFYVGAFVLIVGVASGWTTVMLPMSLVATFIMLAAVSVAILGTGWFRNLVIRIIRIALGLPSA